MKKYKVIIEIKGISKELETTVDKNELGDFLKSLEWNDNVITYRYEAIK